MLVQKNSCSSFFFALLTISAMFITSPSTIYGEDSNVMPKVDAVSKRLLLVKMAVNGKYNCTILGKLKCTDHL